MRPLSQANATEIGRGLGSLLAAIVISAFLLGDFDSGPFGATLSAAEPPPPTAFVEVAATGSATSLKLAASDLASMPRIKVTAKDKSGADVVFEGVELAELLKRAGAPQGEALRGPALALAVIVTAADHYQAVFSLAELDPAMTDKKVILADLADGKPLPPEAGPFRLVVPDDKRHARWVRTILAKVLGDKYEDLAATGWSRRSKSSTSNRQAYRPLPPGPLRNARPAIRNIACSIQQGKAPSAGSLQLTANATASHP